MRKLTWFTVGFAAVCLLGCYASGNWALLCACVGAGLSLAALAAGLIFRRDPARQALCSASRRVLASGLGVLLAVGWFSGWSALFRAPADKLAGETLSLTGTVTSYPAETSIGGRSMTVALDGGLNAPDLLVYATADWDGLIPGDRISFTARLKASDFLYGEDTTYYTAKSLFLLGYCDAAPELLGRSDSIRYWPARCAQRLKDSLRLAFSGAVSPLAIAVTTGDKSALPELLRSALNRSGTAHTVAVSGMHISFLVAAAMSLTRRRRRLAIAFIPFLLFYALMAGGTPSAFRAVIMQSVFLAAPIFRRENDSPTALSFALLLLLLCNPYSAASVSLQLSFASVAGILLAAQPLYRWMARPLRSLEKRDSRAWKLLLRLARGAAASVATSLGAMLFAEPLLCLYFGQLSLVFPLTNLLILWAVSVFFLCALAVGTLGIFLPAAAAFLAPIGGLFGRYIIWVVTAIGQWSFASVDGRSFYYLICLAAVYLFLLLGLIFRRERLRLRFPVSCLLILLLAASLFTRRPAAVPLSVTALDVGQGASSAFLSDGSACLVDCGGSGSGSAGDTAADYFASMGIQQLDLLVLTHFDADHFNGVAELFARMDVAQVAIPDVENEYGRREELLRLADEEGASVIYVTEVTQLSLGGASLTLYPPLGSGTSNEEGLFVLCSAGDFDVLITGDADSFVEKMLLKYYDIPDIELLLVGHHGSAGSTCPELLDELRPELAIISVGYNSYGHPADSVLDLLSRRGVQLYRTDTMGSVTIEVRSDGYAAQTQNG